MSVRTVAIHDRCTREGCGRVLFSIKEGENGVCSSCWFKAMPADTRKAMNRLIASAFNGASESDKDAAVDDAMAKMRRDNPTVNP